MKSLNDIKWIKYLRSLHRDLGYFFVGLICIYALSGIFILANRGTDSAYREIEVNKKVTAFYSLDELKSDWNKIFPEGPKFTNIVPKDNSYLIYVKGGQGEYFPDSGDINLVIYKERKFVKFVNNIHYNRGGHFTWLAYMLTFSLIFFSISGLFLVKGKDGFLRRGIWLLLLGLLLPVIWYFI